MAQTTRGAKFRCNDSIGLSSLIPENTRNDVTEVAGEVRLEPVAESWLEPEVGTPPPPEQLSQGSEAAGDSLEGSDSRSETSTPSPQPPAEENVNSEGVTNETKPESASQSRYFLRPRANIHYPK